jgi:hypothetical protein
MRCLDPWLGLPPPQTITAVAAAGRTSPAPIPASRSHHGPQLRGPPPPVAARTGHPLGIGRNESRGAKAATSKNGPGAATSHRASTEEKVGRSSSPDPAMRQPTEPHQAGTPGPTVLLHNDVAVATVRRLPPKTSARGRIRAKEPRHRRPRGRPDLQRPLRRRQGWEEAGGGWRRLGFGVALESPKREGATRGQTSGGPSGDGEGGRRRVGVAAARVWGNARVAQAGGGGGDPSGRV